MNLSDKPIESSEELEFVIFCLENIATRLGVETQRVYLALTEKSNILNGYIVPEYEVLHTQGKDYIINDILDLMKERGVDI